MRRSLRPGGRRDRGAPTGRRRVCRREPTCGAGRIRRGPTGGRCAASFVASIGRAVSPGRQRDPDTSCGAGHHLLHGGWEVPRGGERAARHHGCTRGEDEDPPQARAPHSTHGTRRDGSVRLAGRPHHRGDVRGTNMVDAGDSGVEDARDRGQVGGPVHVIVNGHVHPRVTVGHASSLPIMRSRSVFSPRCWSIFTADSRRPRIAATSAIDRSSATRMKTTARWSRGRARSMS